MNILVVGSGGREHALAWKIARSPHVTRLVCAPGNPGMAQLGECRAIAVTDAEGLTALAREIGADLVVVGPEASVEAGVTDAIRNAGIACFGPSRAAGQIETSKAFMKALAQRHGVPTAAHTVCDTAEAALAWMGARPGPYVVKADGLAAGKGVVIAADRAEGEAAVRDMLGGRFGAAGARLVMEEFLPGEEISLFVLSDGVSSLPFGSAQDHKRAFDGDEGPNTGGMGAYSPAPALTPALEAQALETIAGRAIAGLAAEGAPYAGALYAGLMLTPSGPRLVEFNARFGDPETQVLMLRLEDDIVPYLMACARGGLAELPAPRWTDQAAICVVLAAQGYPEAPAKGGAIEIPKDLGEGVVVFHAGTRQTPNGLVASGGRVLNVCALGDDLAKARARAYAAIEKIGFPQGFHRRDIGWRALAAAS